MFLIKAITEIQCSYGKLYFSPVMGCFSGEIVAMEMRDNMKKEFCIDTIRQLTRTCCLEKHAIVHSDCGSQYTSAAFREVLKRLGLRQSLSGIGHCFDNARMESFFATLKKENIYRATAYRHTREEVRSMVFRYIFVYYNRIRGTRETRSDCLL